MRLSSLRRPQPWLLALAGCGLLLYLALPSPTQQGGGKKQGKKPDVGTTSYDQIAPVILGKETFQAMKAKDIAGKAAVMARQKALLEERYDLTPKAAKGVTMTRGKPVPVGPTARLPQGMTFAKLAEMDPDQIKAQGLFPKGYLPLPHPNHPVGGMVFPPHEIDFANSAGRKGEFQRLKRFDLDFDLPEPFLPEFPPAIFLTTRPDLGDVSQGKMVSIENFQEIFQGILNAKDMEGMRLLVTQFPQQQFNATFDRKAEHPEGMKGVACFDCHVNGHTSGATHLVGDIRPQSHRRRIDTPTLRGVNVQRIFGSQRAMKSVEDFTQFEQLAAYFDGDPVTAMMKGINFLDRSTQVHFMAEVQDLLDFPPAPSLSWDGKLDARKFKADSPEMRGQKVFFGKGRCVECHPAPYYTDNSMHNLRVERFYQTQEINGMVATAQGPIKTFSLRGIKDSPPYLHDGRLLTLEDTVEFFNLVLEVHLTAQEKRDLVAFMRQL